MRYLIKLAVCVVFFLSMQSCNSSNDRTEIKLVNEYIDNILNSNQPEVTSLTYLDLNKSYFTNVKDSVFFHEVYSLHINHIKELVIDMNNSDFEIIAHSNSKYTDLISQYRLQVKDYEHVFYLVAGGEIWTCFIVEESKIISCGAKLHFGKKTKKEPWFINIPYEYPHTLK